MLCLVMTALIALVGNVSASGTLVNVALNAQVTLHGQFFTFSNQDGWDNGYIVNESTIVDGAFLPRSTQWHHGAVWWDCHDYVDRNITIDLGDVYSIESFVVQADDNDAYLLYFWNITAMTWELAWHVPNYDLYKGVDVTGMQTRPNPENDTERYVLPQKIVTNALMFKVIRAVRIVGFPYPRSKRTRI